MPRVLNSWDNFKPAEYRVLNSESWDDFSAPTQLRYALGAS